MDAWVFKAQKWLNLRYGGVAGYQRISEDGVPGWGTMYALTRALQHELGITSLSNNFGDGTASAFTATIGTLSSTTKNEGVVGILQCALWCTGYSGDVEFGAWTSTVSASIGTVRSQLGLASGSTVDVKLMRSLLTLDAYVLVSGGRASVRTAQQWLNSRYASHSSYRLVPCDGIYSRDVQYGFMLGIQYEIGMADSVANGNFGPGTQAGLKEQANVGSGSSDGGKKWVSLFQLALIFNGYDVGRDGSFGASTVSATTTFQRFLQITASGRGDYDTWAALLVSTGNPDRAVSGVDTSTKVSKAFAQELRAAGYSVIGRYLTVEAKSIARGELNTLFDAGFSVIPIMQNFNNDAEYFTRDIGYTQGYQAAMRARQLGFAANTIIFFPVDYDAFATEVKGVLEKYFEGVRSGLNLSVTVPYKIGVYGTRYVADAVYKNGWADAIWVSGMSTGYSGNLGYPMPQNWSYNQIQEIHAKNIDRNAVAARARPASRSDVSLPPSSTQAIYDSHFDITHMQVLAERAAGGQTLIPPSGASYHVASYLMQSYYDYQSYVGAAAFHAYLPLPQHVGGAVGTANRIVRASIDEAFPDPTTVLKNMTGDGAHMAATAQGVSEQGDHARDREVGMGDLGGWALDLATLFAAFRRSGKPEAELADFVSQHLGTPGDKNTFAADDLYADADGWLIGRSLRQGKTFAEAYRSVYRDMSSDRERLQRFLAERFGSQSILEQAIQSLFTTADFMKWIATAAFLKGEEPPVGSEIATFARAAASTMYRRSQ